MKEHQKKPADELVGVSRRAFFRRAGLTAGGAAIAGAGLAAGLPPASAGKPAGNRPTVGYTETEHVRRAYALARF